MAFICRRGWQELWKEGEYYLFIYLSEAWLGVLTDGSILQDGRWKHVSNTGGLICQAGRHPLCALHMKRRCCSQLKHHLLHNFGTDHLSCLPACGRDHLLSFWREECKSWASQNLMSLQSMWGLILRSIQSSEGIQRKHAPPLTMAKIPVSIASLPPKFSTIIFLPPNWYSVWLCYRTTDARA